MAKDGWFSFFSFLNGKKFPTASGAFNYVGKKFQQLNQEIDRLIAKRFQTYVDNAIKELRRKHSIGYSSGNRSLSVLQRRAGGILRVKGVVTASGKRSIKATLDVPSHIWSHEKKQRISASKKDYLAIPLAAALDSRGLPFEVSPRAYADAFVIMNKRGKLYIVRKLGKGNGSRLVLLYRLKKRVVIPARLGLRDILEKNIPSLMGFVKDDISIRLTV